MRKIDYDWLMCQFIRKNKRHIYHLQKIVLKKEHCLNDIKRYAGKNILNMYDTNQYIKEKILSNEAFMVGRFGGNEMNMIYQSILHAKKPEVDFRKEAMDNLCMGAGFFPNEIRLGERFVSLMIESAKMLDLCGIWDLYMEDYVLRKYAHNTKLTLLDYLEPWRITVDKKTDEKPWTNALKGKKVLVIHPFKQSIDNQYMYHRENIFERICECDDILPEFQLIAMRAVQTINENSEKENFSDWFEALQYMIEQCKQIDFDIAIIGCGAYGFPLAAEIKKMGKGAIHLGGATQILFGIMGKRWEQGEYARLLKPIVNEHWVRPLQDEQVKGQDDIEGGCYW